MTPPTTDERRLRELIARAGDPTGFEAWLVRGQATGWCRKPVRLIGASQRIVASTGEVSGRFSSAGLPDGVLLKACGHRRATRCASCSATYQADAFQLVAAGLRGGKGVPTSVAGHPVVFATFTAPSFGPVHSCRDKDGQPRPCHPGRGNCEHKVPRSCLATHDYGDPAVGQPICADCFDYAAAVIWNAHAGELWRRTTIGIRRSLANLAGISAAALKDEVRVSFTKVVEYQRRGVVHVHALIRLDGASDSTQPPPPPFDVGLLTAAISRTVAATAVPYPDSEGLTGPACWGKQLDVRRLGGEGTVPGSAAAYLAKYSTKSTDPAGLLDRPVTETYLDRLDELVSPHLARLVRTAWTLGGRPELENLRLRPWAHTLGFRGHWLTKSRAYSTTFAALRSARREWQANRHNLAPSTDETVVLGAWEFAGRGWMTPGDAWLARTASDAAADGRRMAAEQRRAERLATEREPKLGHP